MSRVDVLVCRIWAPSESARVQARPTKAARDSISRAARARVECGESVLSRGVEDGPGATATQRGNLRRVEGGETGHSERGGDDCEVSRHAQEELSNVAV